MPESHAHSANADRAAYASVVVDTPMDKVFHYRVPDGEDFDAIAAGDRVLVPFGAQRLRGVVVGVAGDCPIDPARVKDIAAVSPPDERIPKDILELARWVADYYHSSWGGVLAAALPAAVRADRRAPPERLVRLLVAPDAAERAADARPRAPRQAAVLRLLAARARARINATKNGEDTEGPNDTNNPKDSGDRNGTSDTADAGKAGRLDGGGGESAAVAVPVAELSAELSKEGKIDAAALRPLVRDGLVELTQRRRDAPAPAPGQGLAQGSAGAQDIAADAGSRPKPTLSQSQALERIFLALDARRFSPFLLYGVTGSGKTEVYLRALAHTLEQGRCALVLVPEISLTPQTVARFRARSPAPVAVLHSHMSDAARAAEWRRIARGEARVVVGARSAVFAPLADLGLVVVDEEHERSYKQDNDPRYNGRDVALVRARRAGAVALLGSATPSLESWANAQSGKYGLLSLPDRPGRARPVKVTVVDLKREWAEVKHPAIISRELERALAGALERREQAILFLNRRGFHTTARCAACGDVLQCGDCDVPLTYHRAKHILRCHYCGRDIDVPPRCPACSHAAIRYVGTGVERVEDVLAKILPEARTLRMDADTMAAAGAHAEALARFGRGDADILLGTQMVTKGLDFPNVTVVGVLQADGALSLPEFRAAERTFQLVTQVVGRAGRADKPGLAVVQAFQPDHHAIRAALKQDYEGFVADEMPDREGLNYPPYGRLARVMLRGPDEGKTRAAADAAGDALRALTPGGEGMLLGPAPCFVARVQGEFRFHLLLKGATHRVLSKWLREAEVKSGERAGVRAAVDIDPQSLL